MLTCKSAFQHPYRNSLLRQEEIGRQGLWCSEYICSTVGKTSWSRVPAGATSYAKINAFWPTIHKGSDNAARWSDLLRIRFIMWRNSSELVAFPGICVTMPDMEKLGIGPVQHEELLVVCYCSDASCAECTLLSLKNDIRVWFFFFCNFQKLVHIIQK